MDERIDEQRLQRLVDGEMPADERQGFLRELDQRKDAWREVALAFVEDQAWREALTSGSVTPVTTPTQSIVRARPHFLLRVLQLAAAACFVVLLSGLSFQLGQASTQKASQRASAEIASVAATDAEARQVQPFQSKLRQTDERLKALGYRLRAEQQLYEGILKDGRRLAVPVLSMTVANYGQ
jgi:hypothetical protein